MSYDLGIDIGTSYSAAAVRRDSGAVDVVGLGSISDSMPSVVYLSADGSILIGDAANRRSVTDPQGAAREFKRRLGDSTPIILRTSPFSAEQLYARMLEHVLQRVIEREQGPPRSTVVTHPANWGPYKLELFEQALRMSDLSATGLTEPAAAAWAYGAEERIPVGTTLAIYDLGGGTFDAAVLQKTSDGFDQLGETTGIEHLGGVDFDAAVLQWVQAAIGDQWPSNLDDPQLPTAMLHLRRSCSEAKELLSTERDVTIPVLLPGVDTTLTLTRPEFENMIRPKIDDSIASLESALSSAGVQGGDTTIVLVGGSSRIPLIREELVHRFGNVVASDVDPLYAIARGAAVAAAGESPMASSSTVAAAPATSPELEQTRPPVAPVPEPAPEAVAPAPAPEPEPAPVAAEVVPDVTEPTVPEISAPEPQQVAAPAAEATSFSPAESEGGLPSWFIPAAIGALVLFGALGFLFTRGGGDGDETEVASVGDTAEAEATVTEDDEGGGDDSYEADAAPASSSSAPSADGMVEVIGGLYSLGTDRPEANDSETLTQADVNVQRFFIDATEVTNAQWKTFVDTAAAAIPSSWGRSGFAEDLNEHPVVGVNWEWAVAYCEALDKRLPSEAEWEVAARGPDALVYPWGDDVTAGNLPDIEGTYPVGSVATNVSPVGAFDMVGNAWEWVADTYDARVNPDFRVLRGGQNGYLRETMTRLPVDPQRSNAFTVAGFRCAADDVDSSVTPLVFRTDYTVPDVTNEPIEVELPAGVLIRDSFTDSTSGWIERTEETRRFGYHPNEFFHLETKAPNTEVIAISPVAAEDGRPVEVTATAFVEPNNTNPDGSFLFGIIIGHEQMGTNVSFMVDPRNDVFAVRQRQADGTYALLEDVARAIPDDVELTVERDGDRFTFRLNGAVVTTRSITGVTGNGAGLVVLSDMDSTKVHIHYEDFSVSYLDEAGS